MSPRLGRRSVLQLLCLIGNRIRKVKCDELKPFCQKCVSTGRICEGYESPFRIVTSRPINNTYARSIQPHVDFRPTRSTLIGVASQDVDLLNRYFSTKTILDVDVGCCEEAREVLQASLADPSIRHAVLSLIALRADLESGTDRASAVQQTQSHDYGLQQYCLALGGLASNLSTPSSNGLKSALLCCQVFISIEQVRGNYVAMAQHVIRGLRIMHEYRARPDIHAANKLLPAHHDHLPSLDVFIIKLFTAPCKFADPPAAADGKGTPLSGGVPSSHQRLVKSCPVRTIAPNMRTELTRIGASTLEFLGIVSRVKSVESAFRLLPKKAALLDSLNSWLIDLELVQAATKSTDPEPISVSFLRFFHSILRIVLIGALESSPDLDAELKAETDRLQSVANDVGEKVRTYNMWHAISSYRGERPSMH
jgi:hypothetical protein